jgi:hypothetical protein
MKDKVFGLLCILGVLILAQVALGEEPVALAGENQEEPAWFPLLEVGGAIIGIIAVIVTYKNYLGMKGGAVGAGFKFITIAVLSLTAGVIIRGLNEQFGILGSFQGELFFELFIYLGLIAIAFGSKRSFDLMK